MEKCFCSLVLLVQLLMLLPDLIVASIQPKKSETYIIHMDHSWKPDNFLNHESWHHYTVNSLSSTCREDTEPFLYSYTHAMHGFSAKLTPCQLMELEKSPAHVATYKESFGKLFTTHSPEFLGLNPNSGIWPTASYGKDVIIGIFDTGILPESESFSDKGMSEVPSRWKGKCENGTAFSPSLCNNKLIGARSFSKGFQAATNISTEFGFDSARDFMGHGTHTSSTAAGNYVFGASHFGYAKGVARGIAPRAHLAIYKVGWSSDSVASAASDILAAMDQAISDGVDIMSLSISLPQTPYFEDVIAIASLSAIEKGVVVVGAAGNAGPRSHTIYNGAPWIMTVGAGTMDRSFLATLELGNGLEFEGTSYYPASVSITNTPLYFGRDDPKKSECIALDRTEVLGRVVICDTSDVVDVHGQINVVTDAGAYGAIFLTEASFDLDPENYSIPGILLNTRYGKQVMEYASHNTSIVKSLRFVITKTGTGPAPEVADFSSRGPDPITPSILKPDILAPGVNVLAAVRPDVAFMKAGNYDLLTDYALRSGTSMATPHVAGVAALLKAVHRDWSPAAIRSAIMTTATKSDNKNATIQDQRNGRHAATPLGFGAGHIDPNRAIDPGLIYDLGTQDYIGFLCGLGYNETQMSVVVRRSHWDCHNNGTDLNYPSFIASFNQTTYPLKKKFTRTVTNVGAPTSTYWASLEVPSGMIVSVEPNTIRFTSKYQKQDFVLSIQVDKKAPKVNYGYLKWIDEHNHMVSSPIVVTTD